MANHHNLFKENIPKLKRCGGGSQYIGLCRFHDDSPKRIEGVLRETRDLD